MYQLPSSSKLNIASLAQLFNNTSECYKFFWFQAILNKLTVKNGASLSSTLTFDSLVNEMIVNAWFMVNEYHLNLGPADNLENVVKHLQDISGFQSNVKREKLLNFIANCGDERVKEYKKILISNVPYRLQAPFMSDFKGSAWHVGVKKLIEGINEHDGLIYKFGPYAGLATEIHLNDAWIYYMEEHQRILDDWMKYNLISYLERRNPGVPGIINKLTPPEARDLKKVTEFWKTVMQHREITEFSKSLEDIMTPVYQSAKRSGFGTISMF